MADVFFFFQIRNYFQKKYFGEETFNKLFANSEKNVLVVFGFCIVENAVADDKQYHRFHRIVINYRKVTAIAKLIWRLGDVKL